MTAALHLIFDPLLFLVPSPCFQCTCIIFIRIRSVDRLKSKRSLLQALRLLFSCASPMVRLRRLCCRNRYMT
uniref:Secreted protein n=1 Tax=Trichuris muris TaxID=70415 RepID=A0A5S6R238_TRIMR